MSSQFVGWSRSEAVCRRLLELLSKVGTEAGYRTSVIFRVAVWPSTMMRPK